MRIVFAGTPSIAVPYLHRLVEVHDVVAVVTNPANAKGRRSKSGSDVARAANELGIEVIETNTAKDPMLQRQIASLKPDCIPVVAWGALIPQSLLGVPTHGWVNMHYSLLPAWRGAAPVQRAIMAGEQTTGVTTFEIVAALDAGPIYRQAKLEIDHQENAGQLLERLTVLGVEQLELTLLDIENGITPMPQPTEGISVAPKILIDDARIDWNKPADQVVNLIRGTNPAPGAWTGWRNDRFKVLEAGFVLETKGGLHVPKDLPPGELHATKFELFVGTSTVPVRLDRVQAMGKKAMSGIDWARGANLSHGDHLG